MSNNHGSTGVYCNKETIKVTGKITFPNVQVVCNPFIIPCFTEFNKILLPLYRIDHENDFNLNNAEYYVSSF
ncbi:hypothetical protein B4166_2702 [Caldibacillus thermoamylovorans]|uniref:Uncharacterized protein n=1 Tax=Caldibacillus thermoamylovorans TaxID=35841 RepID=A0ABD4A6W1_9BACI|nr:hypothetical protein B4166_2702 [Caldibacillus thermoamylovorans]KIO71962.1 hypothetical protein B4167_3143 [Caldibacillus thermoamylovorans]